MCTNIDLFNFDQYIKAFPKNQGGIRLDAPHSFYRWKPLVSMLFFLPDRISENSFVAVGL